MSKVPEVRDIRDLLEGYGITISVVSDNWITNRMTRFIVPYVEAKCRTKVDATEQVTEYLSGTGSTILPLSRRNVVSLDSIGYVVGGGDAPIQLGSVELVSDEGILKSKRRLEVGVETPNVFARGKYNIKVTYTVGRTGAEEDFVTEALAYLAAEQILGHVGSRTGGGDLSVQAFGRGYGNRGKYTHVRNDLARHGWALLKPLMTGVVAQ